MNESDEETIAKLGSLEYLAGTPKSEVDALRARWHARLKSSQQPLLRALARYGIEVNDIYSVGAAASEPAEVIELLLEHMTHHYPAPIRGGIAGAIRGRAAARHWEVLRALYIDERNMSVKQALAVAFGEAASLSGKVDEIASAIIAAPDESSVLLLRYLVRDAKDSAEAESRLARFSGVPGLEREVRRLIRRGRKIGQTSRDGST